MEIEGVLLKFHYPDLEGTALGRRAQESQGDNLPRRRKEKVIRQAQTLLKAIGIPPTGVIQVVVIGNPWIENSICAALMFPANDGDPIVEVVIVLRRWLMDQGGEVLGGLLPLGSHGALEVVTKLLVHSFGIATSCPICKGENPNCNITRAIKEEKRRQGLLN